MGILRTRGDRVGKVKPNGCSLWLRIGALFLVWFMVEGEGPRAMAQAGYDEKDIKAVFLCRFAQYVTWPATAFKDDTTPITIGILGDDPFGKRIEEAIAGEKAQNRKLEVKRSNQVEDLRTCHILFVSSSEKGRLPDLLKDIQTKGTLIVGDMEGFVRMGGMISFKPKDGKVKFDINEKAAKRAGLKISSQLLRLGDVVE